MRADPLVSFVIPTFKRPDFLREAIDSVLSQNEDRLEIIVVDDDPASNSGAKVLVQSYNSNRIIYFQNRENSGPGYSRRRGLLACRSKYVVFMDDDDFYSDKNFVTLALSVFNENSSEISFVAFNAYDYNQLTGETNKGNVFATGGVLKREVYLRHFMLDMAKPKSTFTTIFNRELLYDSGISEVRMLNDTVIYLRALLTGDAVINTRCVGCYRIHQSNITKSISAGFIIENLSEKVKIADRLTLSRIRSQIWLYRQCKITILYFFENSNRVGELPEIVTWIHQQSQIVKFLLLARLRLATTKKKLEMNVRGRV